MTLLCHFTLSNMDPSQYDFPNTPQVPPSKIALFYTRHQRSIWLSLLTLALAVAVSLTYALFFRGDRETPVYIGDVLLAVTAPRESVSGSEISYEVKVENFSSTRVSDLVLEVFYPEGFTFIDSTPDAADQNSRKFLFPDLASKEKTKLVILGKLSGNVQEVKFLTAKLRYVPEVFRTPFIAESRAETVVLAPDVVVSLSAPAQIVSGQLVTYRVEVSNISGQSFSDLELVLAYPERFVPSSDGTSSRMTGSSLEWDIERLVPGETKTFEINGRLSEPVGTDSFIQAELFAVRDGQRFTLGRNYAFTRVTSSPLQVSHTVNSRELSGAVNPGDSLEYEVRYENVGDLSLNNVAISLVFETSEAFDFTGITGTSGFLKGNALVFLPASSPELRIVDPGENGLLKMRLTAATAGQLGASRLKNPVLKTHPEFSAKELPESLAGSAQTLKIRTALAVATKLTHVSGPQEPAPRETSVYQIELSVTNTVNDVEGAELEAALPYAAASLDLETVNPEEAANLQYTREAGLLRWKLGRVFALTGSFHDPRTLAFQIVITPATSDFQYTLLKDIEVTGTDEFTGESVAAEGEEVEVR